MKKKLIIFIPHLKIGGVEKNFYIISNFLIKKLKDVSIITINKNISKKLGKKANIISIKSNRFENSHIYVKYIICIYLLIRTLLKSRKYVVFSFQANWYSIIISKLFNLNVIIRSNTAPNGWSKNFIKRFLYKILLKLSDEVIVNSIEFKNVFQKEFSISPKCIYNPLNKDEIKKLGNKKLKNNFFNKKYLNIFNYSRLTDQKNHILLLRSLRTIKNKIPFRLIIAGNGPEKDKIKKFINENNLTKNIKLIDFLENPFPLLKLADVLVLSSNFEGLPNVLLEAQVFKKIIISSNCPTGPKEILNNGKYGYLFKCGDHDDLSKKIEFIFNNKKQAKIKAKDGFKNLKRFNKQKNLIKYENILLKYLGKYEK